MSRRSNGVGRRTLAFVVLLLLTGCHHRLGGPGEGLTMTKAFEAGGARFVLRHHPDDAAAANEVRLALIAAAPLVTRWGPVDHEIEVRLHPSHEALERAVRRRDYPWLRAWALYDVVHLQSPRTYSLFEGGLGNLTELLAHELTHCVMYQQVADKSGWRRRDRQIPIWFREGMASWTSGQGHRRFAEARLARWRADAGRDPIREAEALYQRESGPVYSAGHWAFAFLVEQYGVEVVTELFELMATGAHFDDAFAHAVGLPRPVFEAEFGRYLAWEGWLDRDHPSPARLLPGRTPALTSPARAAVRPRRPWPRVAAGPGRARSRDAAAGARPPG